MQQPESEQDDCPLELGELYTFCFSSEALSATPKSVGPTRCVGRMKYGDCFVVLKVAPYFGGEQFRFGFDLCVLKAETGEIGWILRSDRGSERLSMQRLVCFPTGNNL